jgi:8-oxo-dGTP pyrophosphatase MutT (NUDIX family)
VEREFSAGGIVIRRFRGRPFAAAIRTKGGTVLALPKGHAEVGESSADAATREVREETGLDAAVVEKLGDIRYWYARRGDRIFKTVTFFLLRYRGGSLRDHDREVEGAEWIPLEEAATRLAYRGEREMAAAALSRMRTGR